MSIKLTTIKGVYYMCIKEVIRRMRKSKGKGEKMVKLKTLKEHICCFNDVRSEIDIRCTTCGKKNIKLSAKEFMK